MSLRTILTIVLALICGASAVVVVYQIRHRSPAADTVPVLTAKVEVPRGTVLEAQHVKVKYCQKESAPADALKSPDELAGRMTLVALSPKHQITDSILTSKDGGHGLAAMIPNGMRALTIQTTHVAAGVGGFIQPGDKVDVLLTTAMAGQDDTTGGGVTTTLLQNVQVLAVAQRLDAPDDNKDGKTKKVEANDVKCVTLLVSPDQAAKLDLGMNRGILHLALRNSKDNREAHTRPATMAQLRFHQEKPLDLARMLAQETDKIASLMAPKEKQESSAPQAFAEIRTLRGSRAGTVFVEVRR
jgi:pilus assembly protein CpaB